MRRIALRLVFIPLLVLAIFWAIIFWVFGFFELILMTPIYWILTGESYSDTISSRIYDSCVSYAIASAPYYFLIDKIEELQNKI